MNRIMYKRLISSLFLCVSCLYISAQTRSFEGYINPENIYNIKANTQSGIIGTVESGGLIEVKVKNKNNGTLMYHVHTDTSLTNYGGEETAYHKSTLGQGAIYYPNTWYSKDIKSSFLCNDRFRYDTITDYPYDFISKQMEIIVEISETNAKMTMCCIPGIGLIDEYGGNPLFHPSHYCHALKNANTIATKAWVEMKTPKYEEGKLDLSIATHRGFWGDKLGAGDPENSTAAIAASKKYTDILETDIMITKDGKLVVSHDYNLLRLTDYQGADNDYLYNMDSTQVSNLHLRRKNLEVTDFKMLSYAELLDEAIINDLVITVDIKDIRARYKDGKCVDNCEYDPSQHPEASLKIEQSWMRIFKECIRIAAEKDALEYIAFKGPYTLSKYEEYVSADTLEKVLFMPIVRPGKSESYTFDYIDSWIHDGVNRAVAIQTGFKSKHDDPYLQPFTHEGKDYLNLLHYVYEVTGLRPGVYTEEAMGPKGVVSRYGEWKMKTVNGDNRADHYFLMSIPYGNIMVLTTDRPDIWAQMTNIYNNN